MDEIDNKQLKGIKHKAGQAEAGLIVGFISLDRFLKPLIHKGGIFAILGIGILDTIKAATYWYKSLKNKTVAQLSKIEIGNLVFYTLKAMAAWAGVGLVYAGSIMGAEALVLAGFASIIGAAYAGALRHSMKAINYGFEGNSEKALSNLKKVLLGAMIATGFVLYAFYPEVAVFGVELVDVGYSLAIAATGYILLTSFYAYISNNRQGNVLETPESTTPSMKLRGDAQGNSPRNSVSSTLSSYESALSQGSDADQQNEDHQDLTVPPSPRPGNRGSSEG